MSPVIRVERLTSQSLDEPTAAGLEMTPVIDALRAAGEALEQQSLEAARVDLENAELELRCHDGIAVGPHPTLARALEAVTAAREQMARAETAEATTAINRAIGLLSRL
ncbi:hypothetical protein JMJ55_15755 [Belnapia sp. T6]|uniref:Uncharacterized protein n=1 Tax=Belnapia mucosa TaxID=2804532 RepID=A0ABS1V5A6_9PROT|nr:hypothetical protein [Belnapia mucosa]MBL6456792.1 hypothetical protein [Belnapia mucosa]